jgi:lipopolysaccharide export system permease protein
MRIMDRYVVRQFFTTFIMVVMALPFLFLITDVTERLDRYLERGIPPADVAISYVYFIPQLIFWGFPIAALIATVFTIGNMTRHQEITAAKAGGISFYRLASPLILIAVVLSGMAVGIGEIVPVANQRRAEILGERQTNTTNLRVNFVFRTENGKTLAASRLSSIDNQMMQLVVESETDDGSMRVHQAANSAHWSPAEGWMLADGYVRWMPEGTEEETTFYFGTMKAPDLEENPEELLTIAKEADEMRYRELERFIRTVERAGGTTSEYETKLAQKVSLPLALFVIVLFGAPLATSSKRGGAAFGIGISLAVTMVYLMLFKVGEAMGTSGSIDPMIAAWGPNALFLLAALVFLFRVRT